MAGIPFPLSSAPGRSPQEGAGRLKNCYAEPLGDVARTKAVWRRSPGLTRFSTTIQTDYRGGLLVGSTFYAAFQNRVRTFDSTGTEASRGNLAGTSKVFWARNNASTPDIVVVDPDNGAFIVDGTGVHGYPDADLPAVNGVDVIDGFFVFTTGDGRAFASGINTTAVNPLDFASMEAKPDSLLRPVAWNGLVFFFGTQTTEIWADTANPTGFPFSRSTVIPRGLAGRYAVAGYQDGFNKALIWVGDHNRVVRLKGYEPEDISPPDLDRMIEAVTDKNTLEASVYMSGGRSVFVLSCDDWTWEFNLNTEKWNERQSYGLTRWRGTQGANAFGKWLFGDTESGNLLYVNEADYTEDGDPLVFQIESGPVQKFPHRIQVARADFQFAPGTGIATGTAPIETDPTVQVSWSRDGGRNWSTPLFRALGQQSKSHARVSVTRCGLSTPLGHRWRLTVSDPVYAALMQGDQLAEMRAT